MLRIDRVGRTLARLEHLRPGDAGLLERDDIQQMIVSSPDAFFEEMGERLLVIGQEVRPVDFAQDRIDILAIDAQGAAVVIEIKRGDHKLHLLQALSYAAMVTTLSPEQFIEQRSRHRHCSMDEAREEVEEQFLDVDLAELNRTQRIILLAGDFDPQVLMTAEWLSERFDVDVRCYRMRLAADGTNEYLTCTCIYPPPELLKVVKDTHPPRRSRPVAWSDWDEALSGIPNEAVAGFFRDRLAAGRPGYLPELLLTFEIDGRRRFLVWAKKAHAYTWQLGRFAGDEEFWRGRLGTPDVTAVKGGRCLRFFLSSPEQFTAFESALDAELRAVTFLNAAPENPGEGHDPEGITGTQASS